MFIILFQLTLGKVRLSSPFTTAEEADRWRRQLLLDPDIVAAEIVPADQAAALIELEAAA